MNKDETVEQDWTPTENTSYKKISAAVKIGKISFKRIVFTFGGWRLVGRAGYYEIIIESLRPVNLKVSKLNDRND